MWKRSAAAAQRTPSGMFARGEGVKLKHDPLRERIPVLRL